MIKLIHGADFHLDSPFSGLAPDQAAQRRREQRELLSRLARLAREREAGLVLLSGDLLDGRQTYRETAQALAQTLGEIPCPVLIAPGNHDPYTAKSLYAALDWPDNVHIFSTEAPQYVEFPALKCAVWGSAFTSPHREDDPLAGFRAQAPEGWTKLAVLHGEVEGKGDYAPISKASIAGSGLDYLALGHIHQYSGLQREGNTFWAYPGCPEGRGFDETGDKGVLAVTVDDGGAVSAEFVPLAKRHYEILTVDVTGAESPAAALEAALPAAPTGDCCRIVLTGERDTPPDIPALTALAEPYYYSLTLRDHTRQRRELWARSGEDSLTGLFLRTLKIQQPEGLELAAQFGLAALENGEDPCP